MSYRRQSMNTSLKNARIFDEDSSERKKCKNVTEEIKIEQLDESFSDNARFEVISKNDHMNNDNKELYNTVLNIKQESIEDEVGFGCSKTFQPLRSNRINVKQEICEYEGNTNDSTDSTSNQSRKSAKKSVFKREDPYTKPGTSTDAKDLNQKSTWTRQKSKREYETDTEVLARRQKQIDFGKNTIGYDNYIRNVPRYNRTVNDPATPDKYCKYSRRAWDGLIRKWRIGLHKHDLM